MKKDGQEKEVMIMMIIKNQKEDINPNYNLTEFFFYISNSSNRILIYDE